MKQLILTTLLLTFVLNLKATTCPTVCTKIGDTIICTPMC